MATGTPAYPTGTAVGSGGITGNWTPTDGALLLVAGGSIDTGNAPVKCAVSDGIGTTYTEITGADDQVGTSRLTLYSAIGNGVQRQLTGTAAGTERRPLAAVEITGAEIRQIGGSPSVATDTDTAGDPAVASWPLGDPLSTSTVVAFILAGGSNQDFGTISGYTELTATGSGTGTPGRLECHYKVGTPGTSQSTTSTNTNVVMILVELVEPVTGQPFAKRLGGIPGMALIPGVW